jgi:dTDP-4-amino-4,6-dideoxygalactose transaminase
MNINLVDLKRQYSMLNIDWIMEKIKGLITIGGFVGGPYLEEFESKFSNYNNCRYTIGVGSGTDALILALRSLGVGPGDEVIVPANTFIATAIAATHVGADVVFSDVNPDTYLMDESVESYITNKTKVIIPVHLYGNTVYMPKIMQIAKKYDLYVIEDCAQAIGAKIDGKSVGTFGHAGCFSFYPAKNLGGLGQGGAVITNIESISNDVRSLGNVGRTDGSWYGYDKVGYNSRLDSINALFLTECLNYIDIWNDKRKNVALMYKSFLCSEDKTYRINENILLPHVDKGCDHVYHLYEIRTEEKETRNKLLNFLKENGIGAALHYPITCNNQPIYNGYGSFNIAEGLADTLLSIPMHPYLSSKEVRKVSNCITKFYY